MPLLICRQKIENCPVSLFKICQFVFIIMYTVYVLLGGNEGNVPEMFRQAVVLMQDAGFVVSAEGSLYRSDAWGEGVHGIFYNKLLVLKSKQEPREILSTLLTIEKKLGRERKSGIITNRTIDIDILIIDDLVISELGFSVPHPRLHLRKFALIPLCELVPNLSHPVIGLTMQQLLNKSSDRLLVEKVENNKHPDVRSV